MRYPDGRRSIFYLIDANSKIYCIAGQRWIAEIDLNRGYYETTDDNDELVKKELPEGCQVIEIFEPNTLP